MWERDSVCFNRTEMGQLEAVDLAGRVWTRVTGGNQKKHDVVHRRPITTSHSLWQMSSQGQRAPKSKIHTEPPTSGAIYPSGLFSGWAAWRHFCLFSNIIKLDGTSFVVLKAAKEKKKIDILWNSTAMSQSWNHDLVTQDNRQPLFWAVLRSSYFFKDIWKRFAVEFHEGNSAGALPLQLIPPHRSNSWRTNHTSMYFLLWDESVPLRLLERVFPESWSWRGDRILDGAVITWFVTKLTERHRVKM